MGENAGGEESEDVALWVFEGARRVYDALFGDEGGGEDHESGAYGVNWKDETGVLMGFGFLGGSFVAEMISDGLSGALG